MPKSKSKSDNPEYKSGPVRAGEREIGARVG